jgi:hypothetical protein
MLRNRTYAGTHVYGKRARAFPTPLGRQVPALFSVEQWDRAQARLKRNARRRRDLGRRGRRPSPRRL